MCRGYDVISEEDRAGRQAPCVSHKIVQRLVVKPLIPSRRRSAKHARFVTGVGGHSLCEMSYSRVDVQDTGQVQTSLHVI